MQARITRMAKRDGPQQLGIALGALIVATVTNGLGVKVWGRSSQLGVIAELIVLVVITSLVLVFGHAQSPTVFLSSTQKMS